MSQWERPVRAADIFRSDELSLRLTGEVEVDRRGADEGEGTGYDNLDMSAYAERVIVPAEPWPAVREEVRLALADLGWIEGRQEPDAVMFSRDAGETAQVQLLPAQEHWEAHYGRAGPFVRILVMIAPVTPA